MKEKEVKRRPAAWFVTTPLLALALGGFIGPDPGHSAAVVEEVPSALDAVQDLPPIPNLDKFIKSEVAAIRLGKALFWDMQAGSDGQACASCHFHAGADSRAKNQLTPGLNAGDVTFQPTASGNFGGPNYTLVPEDFPFHQKVDELDRALGNNVAFDTNDGASSQGVFNTDFIDVVSGDLKDDCAAIANDIFHIGINNTRRVEPRQTPTVINAALNFENFWDGRAKNNFNGVSPIGFRDNSARVWRNPANGGLVQVKLQGNLALINSSLASQAVGPPLSNFEMSCAARTFPKIGRKLIPTKALKFQQVHNQDSVLGPFYDPHGKGLQLTYEEMIKAAFKNQWWNATDLVELTDGSFTQMEANFSLFWGISIMLYERTLVSDKTPFDDFRRGDANALTPMQQRGLAVFMVPGKCVNCHATAAFTKASTLHLIPENQENGLVERMLMGDQDRGPALYDNGFYNIGVRPTTDDIARGAEIPLGEPLSFTRQYLDLLLGKNVPDPFQINECTFTVRFDDPLNMSPLDLNANGKVRTASGDAGDLNQNGISDPFPVGLEFDRIECNNPDPLEPTSATVKPRLPANAMRKALQRNTIANFRTAVDGSFKVPTLRNINLTGPFMHNGGMATLWQVVAFYNRGGDFFEANEVNVDPDIVPLGLTLAQRVELVAFLNALTDPRVANEEDVYDHPQLFIAHGGTAAEADVLDCVTELNPATGVEKCANAMVIPAVGIRGRSAENLPPLQPFQLSPTSGDLNQTVHQTTSQVILKIRSLFLPIIEKLIRDKQLAIYEPQLTILLGHIETLTSGLAQNLSIEASLSACELRIASLVKHGMTSEEIAAHLMISPATVRTHRRNIRQKLKISGSQDSLQTHLQSLEHRLTAPALSGNISADPAVGYRPQDRNGTHAAQHARITRYPVMHQMHPQPQPPVPTLAKSPQVFYNDTQHLTHASGTSQGAPNGIGKYLRSRGHHFKAQSDH